MEHKIERKKEKKSHKRRKEKSVFMTVFASLLAVLMLEVTLVLGFVFGTEIPQRLQENAEQILIGQIENRADYLKNYLVDAENLSTLFDAVTKKTRDYLQSRDLAAESLNDMLETTELLEQLSGDLISVMRSKSITGIFVIFNTRDIGELSDRAKMPGVYLRDLDPDAPMSERNEDIFFEFAPSGVVQSTKIYTSGSWKPSFEYIAESGAFVREPFSAAYESEEKLSYDSYGYWTVKPFNLPDGTDDIITYSVPIILDDGTVCGVIGTELRTSYVMGKLPYTETGYEETGAYILSYTDSDMSGEEYTLNGVVASTQDDRLMQEDGKFDVRRQREGGWAVVCGEKYYVYSVPLNLYSRNAPFSNDAWMLSGVVGRTQLYKIAISVHNMFLLIAFVMILLGVSSSLAISRKIAKPVAGLSAEIADFEKTGVNMIPELSDTGIAEFDRFADAFTKLSRDVLDTSTRFLGIMDMASIEIGGYEIKYGDAKVFVTDNFFSMLGIEEDARDSIAVEEFKEIMSDFYAGAKLISDSAQRGYVFEISDAGDATRFILLRISENDERQIGLVEDITASEIERRRLEYDRDFDVLTGLYNRNAFTSKMHALFRNRDAIGHAALLMFDIDNLKRINDTYGHDWGDKYIKLSSRYISESLPEGALCSHFSGDEFFAFVYGYDNYDMIGDVMRTFSESVEKYVIEMPDGEKIRVSASCGIAKYPDDSADYRTLRRYADFAMYQVKHGQKGKMKLFDIDAYNRNMLEVRMNREFMQILGDHGVKYHFQPIFSADDGEVVAYEALMRVDGELLKSPSDVIKIAHKQNKLYDIEKLTLYESTRSFSKLLESRSVKEDAKLFINSIPGVVLDRDDFDDCMSLPRELIRRLVIEITEVEKMDYDALRKKKRQFGDSVEFALDDYGSGYSNDATLIELSPEYIKVDYSIIHGIDSNTDKQQIVINIVSYAHRRDKKIVAEGIETADELRCVLDLGVDLLQGFFLGRPSALPGKISPEAMEVIRSYADIRI